MKLLSELGLDSPQQEKQAYHRTLTQVMLSLAAVILVIFSIVHVFLDLYVMAVVQGALAIVYALAYFDFFKIASQRFKEMAVVTGTCIFFWFFLIDGGIAKTAVYWIPFFPFMIFAVAGVRRGLGWIFLFLSGAFLIQVFVYLDKLSSPYTFEEMLYFFISFIFYVIVGMLFEALRSKQQHELEEKNNKLVRISDTLNDTLATLEEEVGKQTYELKLSNRKLAQEVDKHKQTNTELKSAEQRFYQAQKMEALGTLVAGIAHDFNSLLAGINTNLFLLQRKIKDTPQAQAPLDDIEKMVFHASNMTKQLLTYARKDDVEKSECNLSLFMQDSLKLLKTTLPSRIKIEMDMTKTPLPVLVSTTQIQQVLMNLVNNARDALSSQKIPVIRMVVAHLSSAKSLRSHHPVVGEHWAYITVQDNGKGISTEDLSHIFDPFFTTKETGEGTGLGLAMCYGAIESHGGVIEVESKLGQGSTFHVYLPLVKQKQQQTIQQSVGKGLQGKGETILLVDDDENLCRAQQSVLENLNYQVLLAGNGFEAIKVYAESNVDMVIMDIMMPEMGGIKAAQHILTMDDTAKIIFASGYDKDSSTERFLRADFVQVERLKRLDKPFTIQQLCQIIRSELDNK